jgi:RHS repeat-associated protein
VAGLGGPAKFWTTYTFDTAGNRKTEVLHGTTDTKRTYNYPASGGAAGSQPHAVTQVVTTAGTSTTPTRTENYAYDKNGDMICRPTSTATNNCPAGTNGQVLDWTETGRLAKATDKTGTTSYVYDADGNRLLRRDPAGTTLYLPGGTEIRKPVNGAATGTRYYAVGGTTVAVRTPAGVTWLVNDHHGTGSATVSDDGKGTVTRRRTLPFGNDRGTSPGTWAGDKGFVGGTRDNTGLTHLGAREYDPALGRFISVDPVMDMTDPAQWNGYGYADDNPVGLSDPGGLDPCIGGGGGCHYDGTDPGGKDENGWGGPHSSCTNDTTCSAPSTSNSGGSMPGHVSNQSKDDDVVKISEHVAVHISDPSFQGMRNAYIAISQGLGKHLSETDRWAVICLAKNGPCPKAFKELFEGANGSLLFPYRFDDAMDIPDTSAKAGMVVGAGAGGAGYVRSLLDPESMVGATEAEVAAMVPTQWKAGPATTGDGTRWMAADDPHGKYGTIRYMRGGSPQVDEPLHQSDYINVRIGGLEYRAAAAGNPVIEDPNIDSVQVDGRGPIGRLFRGGKPGEGLRNLPEPPEVPEIPIVP